MHPIDAMNNRFKEIGLRDRERQNCLETYRDAGEAEAMELAHEYVTRRKVALRNAEAAMNAFFPG